MSRRFALVVLTVLLVTGGCTSKKKSELKASTNATTTTTSTAGDAATSTTAAGGGGTTTTRKGATTTTARAGATATTTPSGPGTPPPASQVGANPGTYKYHVTGTSPFGPVDAENTLAVDAPAGSDQHTNQTGQSGTTETVYHYQSDGVYIKQLKITNPAFTAEFKPPAPVLGSPVPATVGKSWNWTMMSTDGKYKLDGTFAIPRTETVKIGGEDVPCSVIEATLKVSGAFTSTSKETLWGSEKYRLVVQVHDVTDATYNGAPIHSDTTSTLKSTKPS